MTSRDFCFWLQGHLEISKAKTLSPAAVREIRRHLELVFQRVKPKSKRREIEYCSKPNQLKCGPFKFVPGPFLRKLDKFERDSRKSNLLVK